MQFWDVVASEITKTAAIVCFLFLWCFYSYFVKGFSVATTEIILAFHRGAHWHIKLWSFYT